MGFCWWCGFWREIHNALCDECSIGEGLTTGVAGPDRYAPGCGTMDVSSRRNDVTVAAKPAGFSQNSR
jgi:hypothetical protein